MFLVTTSGTLPHESTATQLAQTTNKMFNDDPCNKTCALSMVIYHLLLIIHH